ncbi:hypothetical protein C1645_881809 [Glomus cerebriforme]|uniref:BACK domain-containing protein n=1 Tax=Glomus cerebriforme TaxID=658196 RepID=A0A397SE81_9GLOM|nr:hypothetical protein C1645_881809 [Glomus cerebriforme]
MAVFNKEIIKNYENLYNTKEGYDVIIYADELEFQALVKYFQKILVGKNHYDFIIKNILEITELTYQKESFEKLWDFCLQQICDKSDYLFESTKFLTFNPSILEIILKRDDFCICNEIVIWENLLKWAHNGKVVYAKDDCSNCSSWVGVCAENFNYESWAGNQPTGWVLGSSGYCYHSHYCLADYCGDDTKITVHLDMNKRTCAFTVNALPIKNYAYGCKIFKTEV